MYTRILSTSDVAEMVRTVGLHTLMDETIERLQTVCTSPEADDISVFPREGFTHGGKNAGLVEWMPAMQTNRDGDLAPLDQEVGRVTLKVVGYHPQNPLRHRLPTIVSVALNFALGTGRLLSLVDATFATALRTGAASAVATRCLASQSGRVVGLIGAGAQAVSQLHGISRVMAVKRVLIFDSDPGVQASFANRVQSHFPGEFDIVLASAATIAQDADVICTATSVAPGSTEVLPDAGMKPHVHVNAVGADYPGKCELPLSLLRRALVCPDHLSQAVAEGECQRLDAHELGPDLINLLRGADQFAAYRERPTVFDSTGFALEDHVVVGLLHQHALELGLGMDVAVETIGVDPTDPYGFILGER